MDSLTWLELTHAGKITNTNAGMLLLNCLRCLLFSKNETGLVQRCTDYEIEGVKNKVERGS